MHTSPVAPSHPLLNSVVGALIGELIDAAVRVLEGLRRLRETDSVRPEPDAGDEG